MKNNRILTIILNLKLCLFFVLASTSLLAQQRLEMEGTAIIGNKELPKVLYIVPWKSAEPVALTTPPFISILDEAFHPVERSTFKRQHKYYNAIYAAPENKP